MFPTLSSNYAGLLALALPAAAGRGGKRGVHTDAIWGMVCPRWRSSTPSRGLAGPLGSLINSYVFISVLSGGCILIKYSEYGLSNQP